MVQRLTLIIRLRRDPQAQDWRGQVEMVSPHREVAFRNRRELWKLLETWTEQAVPGASSGGESDFVQERGNPSNGY